MNKGKLYIISAPSGAGKTSVTKLVQGVKLMQVDCSFIQVKKVNTKRVITVILLFLMLIYFNLTQGLALDEAPSASLSLTDALSKDPDSLC